MRRPAPEPPPGLRRVEHRPGLADEMMRELAPLLAEDGIDLNDVDLPDLETLQAAIGRAVERRNLQLFTPVGPARDIAAKRCSTSFKRSAMATPPKPVRFSTR